MKKYLGLILAVAAALTIVACDQPEDKAKAKKSKEGLRVQTASVETGSDGFTAEQRNIKERREVEGKIGSVKHLYVFSPFNGKAIFYSTVIGKVTSSGKRLYPKHAAPLSLSGGQGGWSRWSGTFKAVDPRGVGFTTNESMDAAGTYGSSAHYITWRDGNGNWHKHFITGGQIIHICDAPIRTTEITLDLTTADRSAIEAKEDAALSSDEK